MDDEKKREEFYEKLAKSGISRRDFMKYCTFLTAALGLSAAHVFRVADVFAAPKQRPPVIWLHFAECTGCTEGVMRHHHPYIDQLVLDILSIEYHETLMAAAGHQAEEVLKSSMEKYKGRYICVCEGAISTKDGGVYGKIGGRTFLEVGREVTANAKATICIGTCSSFGGVQAAAPNPGGFKSVGDALDIQTINIPGCPSNPVNFVGTVINYLLLGELPKLDNLGRPLFAYSKTVHDQCPRRSHFEMGEMATSFGTKEIENGWCLYALGCKGPMTHNNCPVAKFNNGTSWPVQSGHPCIGCSEPGFWDAMSPFYMPR